MNNELTIIGGTGHLSTRMVRYLVARGARLKLVARTPEKARRLFGDAVTVVRGDVQDPASLSEALRGSKALYIHLNTETIDPNASFYAEREGIQNVVAAAEANDLTHLMQIAGIECMRPDFFRSGVLATNEIRQVGMTAVRNSHIPHTFFACSCFLDSLPRYRSDNVVATFGGTDNSIHFTHSDQLAEHLFQTAGNPKSFGKTLPVQGLEAIEISEAMRRFFSVYDPKVKVEPLPLEAISGFGLPGEESAFLQHVWQVLSGMKEEFVADDVHAEFGAAPLSLEEFAAKLRSEAAI